MSDLSKLYTPAKVGAYNLSHRVVLTSATPSGEATSMKLSSRREPNVPEDLLRVQFWPLGTFVSKMIRPDLSSHQWTAAIREAKRKCVDTPRGDTAAAVTETRPRTMREAEIYCEQTPDGLESGALDEHMLTVVECAHRILRSRRGR